MMRAAIKRRGFRVLFILWAALCFAAAAGAARRPAASRRSFAVPMHPGAGIAAPLASYRRAGSANDAPQTTSALRRQRWRWYWRHMLPLWAGVYCTILLAALFFGSLWGRTTPSASAPKFEYPQAHSPDTLEPLP